MENVSIHLLKELRERTGMGVVHCKEALLEAQGDIDKALQFLQKKRGALVAKKLGRKIQEGLITSYIHPGGKLGVLLEVNCETDFLAQTNKFKQLVEDLSVHIAANHPQWIKEVPELILIQEEKNILEQIKASENKDILQKSVEDQLKKFSEANCLLSQPFIKDPTKTVNQILEESIAIFGENLAVSRFVRFKLGEKD